MLKLEIRRDDVAAGRRFNKTRVCRQCVATTLPAWIMQPPPDWQDTA